MLTVRGTGQLTLQGLNTYSGGTLLESGQLILSSPTAAGAGTLYQTGGTLSVTNEGAENKMTSIVVSDFVQDGGTLQFDLAANAPIKAENTIYLDGGTLELLVPELNENTTYDLLQADKVEGTFASVSAYDESGNAYTADVVYSANKVTVNISVL